MRLLKVATPSLDSSREALLRRIESLEARLSGEGAVAPENPKPPAAPEQAAKPETPGPPEDEAVPEATTTVEIDQVVELWPAVVDHLRDSGSAMLSTLFDEARPLGIDEERSMLRIGFPASAKFNKKKAESSANLERMTEAVGAIVGTRLRPAYELIEDESQAADSEGSAEMSEEDLIDLIKDNFDASEVPPDEARESEAG